MMKRFAAVLLGAMLFTCTTAATTTLPASRSVKSMAVHDVKRSYILRFPKNYDGKTKLPMVMLLNGANDSAAYAEVAYHFDEKAEKEGFVLVLPDALGDFHAWSSSGDSDSTKDDIAFLTMLLEKLPKDYAIDPKRVYVAGHSAGAIMTYRIAGERPDLIACIGIVAGVVGDDFPAPKTPVPLIAFHGKEDTVLEYPYMALALTLWGKADKCTDPPKVERVNEHVTRAVYKPAAGGADMVAYTLERGNHMWAGGKIMPGKTMEPVQDLPATDVMWDFFKAHPQK